MTIQDASLTHTTIMSKVPMPKEIPPTPQQVDRILQSVVAHTQQLIADDPRHFANLQASFLAFYTHPTFQLILGIPSQVPSAPSPPTNQLKSELSDLKSTSQALSRTVADLQPKVTRVQAPSAHPPPPAGTTSAQGKGPSPTTPLPTFASKAASKPRPSLVLEFGGFTPEQLASSDLTSQLNVALNSIGRADIKFSAARFTKKGNLVLMAHHSVTQSQLNATAPEIKRYLEHALKQAGTPTSSPITARANVKWSKILINSVPVGLTESRGPWTPEECHRALLAHNPAYASLTITQKPSWIRPPSSLTIGSKSSLVVAFEDPDGTARRSLLASKQLYIHGARAKVTRWKETPPPPTKRTPTPDASPSLTLTPLRLTSWGSSTSEESRSPTQVEELVSGVTSNAPPHPPVLPAPPKIQPATRKTTLPTNPPPATRSQKRAGP